MSPVCLAELPPPLLQRVALGGVLRLADRLGQFVRLAVELLDLGLQRLSLAVQGHESIDVGLRAAAAAIFLHQFRVVDDEFAIEHDARRLVAVGNSHRSYAFFAPFTAANSSHKRALALMPRWKSAKANFSFGLCVLSSSCPQPSNSASAFNAW